MSRLDIFLLSEDWCLSWLNCIVIAHFQGLSYHCLIIQFDYLIGSQKLDKIL